MPQALELLIDCDARGEPCALVTIVAIEGTAPRRVGAQMAVSASGQTAGSFSGGCLDASVIEEAQRAIADGVSRRVRYGAESPYIDLVLPCGSGLDLQIDGVIPRATIASVGNGLSNRKSFELHWPDSAQAPQYRETSEAGRSSDGIRVLQQPALRLILAGAGETLLAMCRLARAAEIDVIALSPDRPIAAPLQALDIELHLLEHQHELPTLQWDNYSAAITLFHEHEWELPFLQAALSSNAFLVGAMGSPRAHAARLDALRELGVDETLLQRLRGPLGLLARARTPQELSVSILAEAMQAYRQQHFSESSSA